MDNKESIILGALIPTVLLAVGWVLRNFIFDNKNKHDLRKNLFENIFSPLDKCLHTDTENSFINIRMLFNKMSDEHYSIFPEDLRKYFTKLSENVSNDSYRLYLMSDYKLDADTFTNRTFINEAYAPTFFAYITTNYNWLSKKLGHPYKREKIIPKFLPNYRHREIFFAIFEIAFSILLVLYGLWGSQLITDPAIYPLPVAVYMGFFIHVIYQFFKSRLLSKKDD